MSVENIENTTKSGSFFPPTFVNHYILPDASFNVHCLINNNFSIPKKVRNLFISCILNPWLRFLNTDFTLTNWLFGFVNLTRDADLYRYKYSGDGIGFSSRSEFPFKKVSLFLGLI